MHLKNLLLSSLALMIASLAVLFAGGLAPEPAAIPKRWELQVEFSPLRVYSAQTDAGPRTFYYLTYKALNRTGQDVVFAPSFDLVDGAGTVTKSGRGVPDSVTKGLIQRGGNPLVEDQVAIIGTILQGEENAKEGIVVFTCENFRPAALTLYAAGFSGETAVVKVPGAKDEKGADLLATLRKTRQLNFIDPGDLIERGDRPIDLADAKWVMR